MTDKEKLEAIIAELRRLKKVRGVYKDIYKDIFAFYNSLPSVPVSEDLEEAARKYLKSLKDDCFIDSDILLAFKAGANWQKQQMLAKAVDATVHIDAGGYPYIPQIELYDYDKDIPLAKEGDKYKVNFIKKI